MSVHVVGSMLSPIRLADDPAGKFVAEYGMRIEMDYFNLNGITQDIFTALNKVSYLLQKFF